MLLHKYIVLFSDGIDWHGINDQQQKLSATAQLIAGLLLLLFIVICRYAINKKTEKEKPKRHPDKHVL